MKPIPTPLRTFITDKAGNLERVWANFFDNMFRYQKKTDDIEVDVEAYESGAHIAGLYAKIDDLEREISTANGIIAGLQANISQLYSSEIEQNCHFVGLLEKIDDLEKKIAIAPFTRS